MLDPTEYTPECVRNALDAAEVTGSRNLAVLAAEVCRQRTDMDQMAAAIERLEVELAKVKGYRAELSERCYRKDLELDELRVRDRVRRDGEYPDVSGGGVPYPPVRYQG